MDYMPPPRRFAYAGFDLHRLKPLPDVQYQMLSPNVRWIWLLGRLITWFFMGGGLMVLAMILLAKGVLQLSGLQWGAVFVVLGFLFLWHLSWPFIAYPRWGFAIRQTDFVIRSGVLRRSVIAVPFSRIQHVDSHSGPVERSMGLARLVIHTAGSQMGSVGLPGLTIEQAEGLRDYLSQMGHAHANI